jgi:hypothetical protein
MELTQLTSIMSAKVQDAPGGKGVAERFHLFCFLFSVVCRVPSCALFNAVCSNRTSVESRGYPLGRVTIFLLREIRTNLTLFFTIFCMIFCMIGYNFLEQLTIRDT